MFVHIGGTKVIQTKEIIAIFNMDVESTSPITCEFLTKAKQSGRVEVISGRDEAKSVVVTEGCIYYSPISSLTLKRRCHVPNYSQAGDPN